MGAKYVPIFESMYEATRGMTNEEVGELTRALCEYGFHGEYPDFPPGSMKDVIFKLLRPNVDATIRRSEVNRLNRQGKTKK